MTRDTRLRRATWTAAGPDPRRRIAIRLLLCAIVPLALIYFTWLLRPGRVGEPVMYVLLVAAEVFNLVQAAGFWWTCSRGSSAAPAPPLAPDTRVDVLIPVYDEPADVVEPTVEAASRLTGARARVHLLDDGGSDEMRALAARHGADYIRREDGAGAKAGNINHALAHTDAPYVAVLDCDHVPLPHFLEAMLGHFADERVAFVQAPQYYANNEHGDVASAAWGQQALFFGAIARGKDGHEAMFCCGTNVVFRRAALESAGGFPTRSLTEDFDLSIRLHERGWSSRYVAEVLAHGLGPEDMAGYVSQQQRWARGCVGALGTVLRARLPWRIKLQYLLSASYFLSGWTVLVYMTFPVVRILTGAQPLAATTADQFLVHFAPYFGLALLAVTSVGGGAYTFRSFALQTASFWIHIQATVRALRRRRGRFVVTPKQGALERQPRAVAPALAALAVLAGAAVYGLARGNDPATLNNVAFAALHVCVLACGVAPALRAGAVSRERAEAKREPVPA
ncbi:glycosyltransferase family 2 protein [Candidatus Solirubrobacter pratensis]|uniref:glycosyltransferase family 2 protein n=1 Tax=Candidatus Solirubrobacter pratensis TaxID=1298857 RepID=UPI000425D76A|nr:cellulose synthase catalytic subunit [Candidatus Solirubrobacter pratensis]